MINFRAKYINTQKIIKNDNNQYKQHDVAFVQINSQCENDILCLKSVEKTWGKKALVKDLVKDINQEWETKKADKNAKYFALTSQKNGFEKLLPQKILGVIELLTTSDKNTDYINILEVEPNSIYGAKQRRFVNIGSSILNALKENLNNKDFILEARENVVKFYEKNGFKSVNNFGLMKFTRLI